MRMFRKFRVLTLVILFCSVLGFAMLMPPVAASETVIYDVTGTITQDEWHPHFIGVVPAGLEVKIELGYEEPTGIGYDLDFYAWDNGNFLTMGASLDNPEMAFLSGFATPTGVYVYVHGYWAPDPGVEYYLRVVVGPDVIPDPYAVSGGLSAGDLMSWHQTPAVAIVGAAPNAAFKWSSESNTFRQVIMPWFPWWFFGHLGSGWAGPAYYAGDPLLVGGVTKAIDYDNDLGITNINQARAYFEGLVVETFIDDKPIEDLGNAIEHQCRPDNFWNRWYYREPKVLFQPGELYDLLDKPEDGLHTLTYKVNGVVQFTGFFYLLW